MENKKILIIDDILTTGSTLNEIAKLLIENKVKSIECVTLCYKKHENNKIFENFEISYWCFIILFSMITYNSILIIVMLVDLGTLGF